MLDDLRLFYSEFRQNFSTTGAIVPSSALLGRAMTRPLSQRPDYSVRVLEVGPGTGAFTRHILRHLRPGDRLDIYELNPRFFLYLKQNLPWTVFIARNIECRLHNTDVRQLSADREYDYIVCGLPFNNFAPETVSEILDVLLRHLSASGALSYFEYIFSHEFKARFLKSHERERMIRVGTVVNSFIQRHQYGYHPVWFNLPPARARYCRKAADQ